MIEVIHLDQIVLRPIYKNEIVEWERLMKAHHYLGLNQIVGKSLRYVATFKDEWVALIGWGSAALKCSARDKYLGWIPEVKYKRLDFVVNNVRFLVLPHITRRNLASKILSLNLKRLSKDFEAVYGHPVYLAETFVDESRFYGTCYKASNWNHLGYTSGYSKCNMKYYHTGSRKAVYVYPLCSKSFEILTGDLMPYDLTLALKETRLEVLMNFPIQSLLDEIRRMTDPRSNHGKRHPLETVLAISLCAVLCGARSYLAIADWASGLNKKDLLRFGSERDDPPSEPTIRRVLQRIDVAEFDRRIYDWLYKQKLIKGQAIAIDGKTLRGSQDGERRGRHLLSAVVHKEGIVIAQDEVDEKTNEIKHVKPLFEKVDISGNVITADALITQRDLANHIVKVKKADYLFTVKGNQQTLMDDIRDLELEKKNRILKP